jgi:hypothetical protein
MLDKGFITFVEKHKLTFLLVALLAANVYQYIHNSQVDQRFFDENKRLNEKNIELTFKTLEYERQRSERLEFLLNNLSKTAPAPTR